MLITDKKLLAISKKYYAGGEITTEFIVPDDPQISCQVIVTDKTGKDHFTLGAKYTLDFIKEDGNGER